MPVEPRGRLSAVLAYTFHNPRITVQYTYERVGPYALHELKAAIAAGIDADDDVVTQFVEPSVLKRQVADAQSFDALASVLQVAGLPVDTG